LSVAQQITQSGHAIYSLVRQYHPEFEIPNIVTIGVPDLAALKRVQKKLADYQIPHFSWIEPDFELGFTSIATIPLTYEQKQLLKNYRVYHRGVDEKSSSCGGNSVGVKPDAPASLV
jgi:hypothetical protein